MWGRGAREQCGRGSLKNLTTSLFGRGAGGRRGGRWGGGTREQCGSNKGCTFHLLGSLKNLTTGLIWLVDEGGGGGGVGGGPGRAGKHQRAVWEQQRVHWFHL